MNGFGTKPPVDIPMVRVVSEEGRELCRGWYFRHVKRCPCVFNDWVHGDDVQHIVMHDGFADWNLPQSIMAMVVEPPDRIEIIDDKPWERSM